MVVIVRDSIHNGIHQSPRKKSLAVLGTGSDVGKSILAAGLCRVLHNAGVHVAPFKAQNMSNNAYPALITRSSNNEGSTVVAEYGEIGIAQAIQARACRQLPRVEMNPILLKSGGRRESDGAYLCSVFVLGKHVATEDFGELGRRSQTLLDLVVREGFDKLMADVVILEGAGSCTELNLMDRDVVNLPLVTGRLRSPWILVANIDTGGVFAQVVGTKACLAPEDWDLCVGVVINKLRGDAKYFEPGPRILTEMVGKPIFVIPFLYDLNLAEEDGMGLERKLAKEHLLDCTDTEPRDEGKETKARVVVVCYPHISMTDDLVPLELDDRFCVEWRRGCMPTGQPPRAILLPGSRQTRTDMEWLAQSPWYNYIRKFVTQQDGIVLGLCGGFQMLGTEIIDREGIESGTPGCTPGLGVLEVTTTLQPTKVVKTIQTASLVQREEICVQGYEIHSGETASISSENEEEGKDGSSAVNGAPLLRQTDGAFEGWISGTVAGTYLHGILESRPFRSWFFLGEANCDETDTQQELDPLDRLADHLSAHGLDYDTLSSMIHHGSPI